VSGEEKSVKERVLEVFRKEPEKFVRLLCGIELAKYQRDILLDESKRIILNSGRQVGKSTIVSLKALWRAFCHPRQEILVLGPTERQAKIVFDKIYETIYLNEILMSETVKLTINEIRFKNGSVIRCLPAGKTGEYIRGFCYSEDTEILTLDGWKRFRDLDECSVVMQVAKDGSFSWTDVQKIVKLPAKGKMIRIKNRQIDLLVSWEHRLLVKVKSGKRILREMGYDVGNDFIEIRAGDLIEIKKKGKHFSGWMMKGARRWLGEEIKEKKFGELIVNGDDWVRFMGIWLAEGSVYNGLKKGKWRRESRYYRITISQCKKTNYEKWRKIKGLLDRLGMNYSYNEKNRQFQFYNKDLALYLEQFGKARAKFVPFEIKNATKKQLQIFLDWFGMGDGSIRNGRMRYRSYSKQLMDDIQEMMAKLGRRANIVSYDEGYEIYENIDEKGKYRVDAMFEIKDVEEEEYNGYIYSVKVPTTWVVVRRNGKVVVSGNTADMVIVDEAAYVPDEVYVAIFPALAVKDGQLILMSTPKGKEGFFYKAWESKEWSKYRVPTIESPFVPDGFIEEYKMTHTEVDFRREIFAEFIDYSEMWFDLERVKELAKLSRKKEPLDEYEYYFGVDIAASGTSETVVCVVGKHKYDENMPLEVHNYWYRSKFAITETVGWIKNLNAQWQPEQIIVDQTGLGIGAKQLLNEKLDNVQGITFSSKMRYELYYNMKKLLEDRKVILLDDEKMVRQFDKYTTSYRSDGTVMIKKAEGSDVVDALCLACWGAKKYTGAVVSVLDIEV
jgi:hypothetical protein